MLSTALSAVPAERPRGRKLTQLVADHLFGHEDLQMIFSIMDHERMSDELGYNRACPSPRLDRLLQPGVVQLLDLQVKFEVDVGAFFCGTTHIAC